MTFQDVKIRNEFRRAGHSAFRPNATQGTGHALADFVLGQLDTFDQGTGEYKDYKVFYASAFLQDDYKVSDRADAEHGRAVRALAAMARSRRPHHALERCGLQRQRALHDVPRGAARRDVPRRRRASSVKRASKPSPNTASARVGFAWDITGDGRTSLRGGGGTFYDQRRDGESGNGAVNAPPFSLRLNVTRPAGPFSDPYRGRTDFNLITDATVGTTAGRLPEAGADLDLRRRIQGADHLQLQPHVRARSRDRADGACGVRRFAEPQRPPRHQSELRRLHTRATREAPMRGASTRATASAPSSRRCRTADPTTTRCS